MAGWAGSGAARCDEVDHLGRAAVLFPSADVDARSGARGCHLAVPDRELKRRRLEIVRAQQRQAHRELRAIGEQHLVAEILALRRIGERAGLGEAALEAVEPPGSAALD